MMFIVLFYQFQGFQILLIMAFVILCNSFYLNLSMKTGFADCS